MKRKYSKIRCFNCSYIHRQETGPVPNNCPKCGVAWTHISIEKENFASHFLGCFGHLIIVFGIAFILASASADTLKGRIIGGLLSLGSFGFFGLLVRSRVKSKKKILVPIDRANYDQ